MTRYRHRIWPGFLRRWASVSLGITALEPLGVLSRTRRLPGSATGVAARREIDRRQVDVGSGRGLRDHRMAHPRLSAGRSRGEPVLGRALPDDGGERTRG